MIQGSTLKAFALASMFVFAALSAPVHAADGDVMEEYRVFMIKMADKDGRVAKRDFLDYMGKKFDSMDKKQTGTLTPDEIMRIFGRDATP